VKERIAKRIATAAQQLQNHADFQNRTLFRPSPTPTATFPPPLSWEDTGGRETLEEGACRACASGCCVLSPLANGPECLACQTRCEAVVAVRQLSLAVNQLSLVSNALVQGMT
jgi:hypothetical protein